MEVTVPQKNSPTTADKRPSRTLLCDALMMFLFSCWLVRRWFNLRWDESVHHSHGRASSLRGAQMLGVQVYECSARRHRSLCSLTNGGQRKSTRKRLAFLSG